MARLLHFRDCASDPDWHRFTSRPFAGRRASLRERRPSLRSGAKWEAFRVAENRVLWQAQTGRVSWVRYFAYLFARVQPGCVRRLHILGPGGVVRLGTGEGHVKPLLSGLVGTVTIRLEYPLSRGLCAGRPSTYGRDPGLRSKLRPAGRTFRGCIRVQRGVSRRAGKTSIELIGHVVVRNIHLRSSHARPVSASGN